VPTVNDDGPVAPPETIAAPRGRTRAVFAVAAVAIAVGLLLGRGHHTETEAPGPPNAVAALRVERCAGGPLIVRDQDPRVGDNVNGPSVLRVPDWIEQPLGRYYLYFAHHRGKSIRLAVADAPCGPWHVQDPVLHLDALPWVRDHVASPDVHVDEGRREILMYVHGRRLGRGQHSALTVSRDGLHFEPVRGDVARPYLRRFDWRGEVFAITAGVLPATVSGTRRHAFLERSPDGREPFTTVKSLFPRVRHAAVSIQGETLLVFFSRLGDVPERIQVSTLALGDEPARWRMSAPIDVLRPETPWEGAHQPLRVSRRGAAHEPLRELRDPAILEDGGRTWLFYSIAGESGIAAAELEIQLTPPASATP